MRINSPFGTPERYLHVCGAKANYLGKPYSLVEDRRCNVLFVHPFPTEAETKAFYADRYRGDTSDVSNYSGSAAKAQAQMLGIKQYLSNRAEGSLLDIACGSGHLVSAALEMGFDPYGIDFERSGIESAIKNFPKLQGRISLGTINDVSFRPSFSNVTIMDALEHMIDPISALKKVNALLAKDGHLFIQSIYYDNGYPEQDGFTNAESGLTLHGWDAFCRNHNWEHVMVYSIRGMAYVFSRSGFMLNGVFKTSGHSCPIVVAQKAERGKVRAENKRVIEEYHRSFDISKKAEAE